jgi:hypothetical protein
MPSPMAFLAVLVVSVGSVCADRGAFSESRGGQRRHPSHLANVGVAGSNPVVRSTSIADTPRCTKFPGLRSLTRALDIGHLGRAESSRPTTPTEVPPMSTGSHSRTRLIGRLTTVVAACAAMLAPGSHIASAGGPTCFGRTATILGGQGSERIRGTSGSDVIVGFGGQDVITSRAGNDLVCGKGGADVLRGGPGNDRIVGNRSSDRIIGGSGDDFIRGGRRADRLNVGRHESGDDRVLGGFGNDVLRAGRGRDRLFGNHGSDSLAEGRADSRVDRLSGGLGIDTCRAGTEDLFRDCETRS